MLVKLLCIKCLTSSIYLESVVVCLTFSETKEIFEFDVLWGFKHSLLLVLE